MRIILFSNQTYDRDSFLAANHGHGFELHFQQAQLRLDTVALAMGFEVVCPFVNDDLSRPVLEHLAAGGTKLIALRSAGYTMSTWPLPTRWGCPWCAYRPIRPTPWLNMAWDWSWRYVGTCTAPTTVPAKATSLCMA